MKNDIVVRDEDIGQRIDIYLNDIYDYSRSYLQKLIKDELVLVNDKIIKSNYKLRKGDVITVSERETKELEVLAQNIELDILYEDEDVIVINKPKNMVVHIAPGHHDNTLVNALMYHCKDSLSGINGILRPGIVHRIDMDTTGSIIVCKNDMAHLSIAKQLKDHTIKRKYIAIVYGRLKDEVGCINAPIKRHKIDRKKMAVDKDGKRAVTHYKVIKYLKGFTYIECELETGRTHQIRVHMSYLGHPLLGDVVYGKKNEVKISGTSLQGQCLHAMNLGFVHPRTGQYIEVNAPIPDYFNELLIKLDK